MMLYVCMYIYILYTYIVYIYITINICIYVYPMISILSQDFAGRIPHFETQKFFDIGRPGPLHGSRCSEAKPQMQQHVWPGCASTHHGVLQATPQDILYD
jgi:hypothetical protein